MPRETCGRFPQIPSHLQSKRCPASLLVVLAQDVEHPMDEHDVIFSNLGGAQSAVEQQLAGFVCLLCLRSAAKDAGGKFDTIQVLM